MNTKHTPGPWVVADGHYPGFREIRGPSFRITAVMSASDLTEEDYFRRSADLTLIAAAPLLLEALRDTLEFLERHSNRWDGVNGKHPAEVAEDARAAIAAATN